MRTFISLSGLAPEPKTEARDQKDEFARQLGRIFHIPLHLAKTGEIYFGM